MTWALCIPPAVAFTWSVFCEIRHWYRRTPVGRMRRALKMSAEDLAKQPAVAVAESLVHTAWLETNHSP